MAYIDVFNGDADGICALQQLRLDDPRETLLVTGVKRDIGLLARVNVDAGDRVTVLDISLDKNRDALLGILGRGAQVRYFDHHFPGDLPEHPALDLHIETVSDKGTSLLVDEFLQGRQRPWAVVGTFGDNFDESACRAAESLGLNNEQMEALRELGIYLNYNGYGAQVEDLHVPPDVLYRKLRPFAHPLDFIAVDDTFALLRDGFADDMARAEGTKPELEDEHHALYVLPAEPWARRVGGVFANALASINPERAHAMLTNLPSGGFVVSVRAPLNTKDGADVLCRQFATGGGRKAAAGINNLPANAYDDFVRAFTQSF